MSAAERYDAIVIGAGQAGGPLSSALARSGRRTALIEREHVGGTCINEGCTPTKTMVASARVAYLARRAVDYGVGTGSVTVDMQRVRQRKRDIVNSFRNGSQRRLEKTEGLDLIFGEASFADRRTLEVRQKDGTTRRVTADKIFINSGARPVRLPLPGLEAISTLDSTSVMELDSVPEHLLILGGGYVALEFGQMFRRFGAAVTIVQRAKHLLPREDEDVSEEVAKIMREDGIEVLLDADAVRAERDTNDGIRLVMRTADGERTVCGSHLLVAVGRTPNTDRLNPSAAGVRTDERGYIPVNARLETNVPGIYALGDVNGGPAFTHISYDDFRIIRNTLIRGERNGSAGRLAPYVVFIDPQLGRVGMTEREAKAKGLNIGVAKLPMNHVARALEVAEPRGFMKAVVDADTKQILGCAIFGIEGGEIMAIVQLAIMGRIPYPVIRDTIFSHPTLAEALNNLFMAWEEVPMEVMFSQAAYSASTMR
jgi:pyruvate/2-oxoglutarate dehydrogenase complex dihydrolipoamide dehydrogenase (E3) component